MWYLLSDEEPISALPVKRSRLACQKQIVVVACPGRVHRGVPTYVVVDIEHTVVSPCDFC